MRFVITADLHLCKTVPRCRRLNESEDAWYITQQNSLLKLIAYAKERKAVIIIAGDVFDEPHEIKTASNLFLSFLAAAYKEGVAVYTTIGNHDIMEGNINSLPRCALGDLITLTECDFDSINADTFHYGEPIPTASTRKMVIGHLLVWPDSKTKPPMAKGVTALELLDLIPNAQYLIIGDYHHSHTTRVGNRACIVPGCLTRQTASFADYKPSCVYLDISSGTIEHLPLPDCITVLSREHIDAKEEKSAAIDNLVAVIADCSMQEVRFSDKLRAAAELIEDPAVMDELVGVLNLLDTQETT